MKKTLHCRCGCLVERPTCSCTNRAIAFSRSSVFVRFMPKFNRLVTVHPITERINSIGSNFMIDAGAKV